jgi:lipopolysaccharide export system protein LptA
VVACGALAPALAGAQGGAEKACEVEFVGVQLPGKSPSSLTMFRVTGTEMYNSFYGGGVDARCKGTDQRITADSAEHYGQLKYLLLVGSVHYTENRVKLDSDRMTYYTGEERILAEGNVVGVTNTGTRFKGPRATYFRPAEGIRPFSRLEAEQRPDVWVSPKDAGGNGKDSVNLQADRVVSENDSLISAKGQVYIDRPDLRAIADSAWLDQGKEIIKLFVKPKIVGRGERHFELEGDFIDAYSKNRQVERVKSAGHAKATSDDVILQSDSIDLRITDQKLSRAYSWGPNRARADAKDRKITADSIDVRMPNQQLREMWAVRKARAESQPDTAKITSKEPDWLAGDTIVAHFDTAATADSAKGAVVKQIEAMASKTDLAQSYYQVVPGGVKAKTDKPNVNYVTGKRIAVDFKGGEVETVNVRGKASGIYVEALVDSATVKKATTVADSTKAKAAATKPEPRKRP